MYNYVYHNTCMYVRHHITAPNIHVCMQEPIMPLQYSIWYDTQMWVAQSSIGVQFSGSVRVSCGLIPNEVL